MHLHKSAARYGTLRLGLVQLLGGAKKSLSFVGKRSCFEIFVFFSVLERSVKSRNSCEVHSNVLYIQMTLF